MTDPVWYPTQNDKGLILDFILWFSRVEYALKSDNTFSIQNNGHFQANWDALMNELAPHSIPQELSEALTYIKSNPPLKQTGFMQWQLVQSTSDWDYLIRALKTVRNNLFNGGKHHTGPVLQPVRDRELLEHCLLIMRVISDMLPASIKPTFEAT